MMQTSNLRGLVWNTTHIPPLSAGFLDYPRFHQAHKPFHVFGEVWSLSGHAVWEQ